MENVLNYTGYEMLINNIERAEGYHLFDDKDKKYIDFESGVWSISLGHGYPEFNEAIKTQLDKVMHLGFRYTSKVVEEAAKDILDTLHPFKGKCMFLCTGSEAVECAVKTTKAMIREKLMLTFDYSYLSAYGMSGSKHQDQWYKLELKKCIDCDNINGCSSCRIMNSIPFDKIGAFVFEPGNSSGLVLLPPKNMIKELEKRIKQQGGLIVVDEVTTGIGRTGMWYGYQHYEIVPDIVAIGKGIGNGYPVSAVAFTECVVDYIKKEGLRHSQSHQNDALGCAVVSKVIELIKKNNLIEKSNANGSSLVKRLNVLKEHAKCIKEVRGMGMMIAIEFKEEFKDELNTFVALLFDDGFIVGYNPKFNIVRLYPTLTTSIEDIDSLVNSMKKALNFSGLLLNNPINMQYI